MHILYVLGGLRVALSKVVSTPAQVVSMFILIETLSIIAPGPAKAHAGLCEIARVVDFVYGFGKT